MSTGARRQRSGLEQTRRLTTGPALVVALVLVALVGCAKGELAPRVTPVAPLATENPVELIPAAGLRWLLVGRPRELLRNEAFSDALGRLLPQARLKAFSARTGIDLPGTDAALVAGYDLSTVYAATQQAKDGSTRVLDAFRERLRGGERVFEPHPRLRRISGVLGDVPQGMLAVGDRTALVSVGDPRLMRVAEAFALGKLARSPPALRGVALSSLTPPPAEALAVLYVLGPFDAEWARAAGGLLGSADAVWIALIPAGAGRARVQLELAGDFISTDADRLLEVITRIASSTTGRVLGLDRPVVPATARHFPGHLTLSTTLETQPIADGLYAAVSGEVWEILNLPTPHLH